MKSMEGHMEAQKSRDSTCCGVIEEAAETAREKRMNRTTAQPWIVRKLMVGITAGIMGYTAYVYVRLLCLPMIWQRNGAPATRGTGVALLVVFCVLYLWMVWAYIRVVITSPGYAHDHVQKSDRPLMPMDPTRTSSWRSNTILSSNSGPHDVESGNRDSQQRSRSFSASTTQRQSSSSPYGPSQQKSENGLSSFSYEDLLRRDGVAPPPPQDPDAGTLDSIKPPKPSFIQDSRPPPMSNTLPEPPLSHPPPSTASRAPLSRHQLPASLLKKTKPALPRLSPATTSAKHNRNAEREAQRANLRRWPPTTPVLLPAHRYCAVDEIVKPYRAHHCRACGTCVLKYDHHCPWIGQCVGARNHKFFINFCQAATVLTGYVFGTLLAYTITSTNSSPIDPQHIVIIALAALFLLFTFMLSISHVHLTLQGQTTVESMQIRTMKQREERVLADGFSWWQFGAKRRKQKEWDYEWGRLSKEGNIWWRGNTYDEWIDVMGKNWLGWILPIGRVERNKGLDYPVNARFNADGRWRRRSEWPESFR